jgi:cytochrome bd-type quinol oxidase subunit 2
VLIIFLRLAVLVVQVSVLHKEKQKQEQDWMLIMACIITVINSAQTAFLLIVTMSEMFTGQPLQELTEESHQLMLPIHTDPIDE